MANGVYFGADTLEAEEASAFKQLMKKWGQHGKGQGKQIAKRGFVDMGMDILEKINPWARVAKPFVDYATQKLTPLDEFDEDAAFWTADDITKLKSKDKEFREGADTTLLENILGSTLEYAETEAGGEAMGEFNIADIFGGGGDSSLSVEDMEMGYGGSNLDPTPRIWDEPTQESESGGVDPKPKGKFGFPFWNANTGKFEWNYQQGGQVPEYRGGGSIVNYFAKQNKTLGGSNTDSLAQRLGRK